MICRLSRLLPLVFGLLVSLATTTASAAPITYLISVDTSGSGIPGTMGSLEFQFFPVTPPGGATLSSFTTTGGTLVGSPTVAPTGNPSDPFFGTASGSLAPGNSLTITSSLTNFADVFQDFDFGTSFSFVVTVPEAGAFSLFLWDIPTTDVLPPNMPAPTHLLLSSLDPSANGAALQLTSDGSGGPALVSANAAVTAQLIPEPTSLALFGLGGAALAGWCWRRRRTA